MKQNKLDKAFKGAEKSMADTQTLCGQIQEKLMDIREKLAVYGERRRWRHVQWLNDMDYNLLLILVLCMVGAMLLDKYMPGWLRLVIWAVLLGSTIFVWLRRFFRKAY